MKSKKLFFYQLIAFFYLVVSVSFLILSIWSVAPSLSMFFSSKESQGKILKFESTDDETEFRLIYTYFNEYEKKDIQLVERVHKRTYNKLKSANYINVVYNRLFPYRVHALPSLGVQVFETIILFMSILMSFLIFIRVLKVLKGNLSLEDFLGVDKSLTRLEGVIWRRIKYKYGNYGGRFREQQVQRQRDGRDAVPKP